MKKTSKMMKEKTQKGKGVEVLLGSDGEQITIRENLEVDGRRSGKIENRTQIW